RARGKRPPPHLLDAQAAFPRVARVRRALPQSDGGGVPARGPRQLALFGRGGALFAVFRLFALKRSAVVRVGDHRPPALRLHPLEDPAGVSRRNPTVPAALRTASAKGDVLPAIGTD